MAVQTTIVVINPPRASADSDIATLPCRFIEIAGDEVCTGPASTDNYARRESGGSPLRAGGMHSPLPEFVREQLFGFEPARGS